MGRSVNYLSNAEYVIYFTADWINENDENGEYDSFLSKLNWNDFIINLKSEIKSKLKSYYNCDKWENKENHIFLENDLCEIAISEYCDLFSLSIRAKDNEFYTSNNYKEGLSKYHAKQIKNTLIQSLKNCGCEILNKLGTFSNGESVYQYAK